MEDVPAEHHLVPAAVDYRAKQTPDRVFAVLPKGDKLEDGFFDFTYAALAKATDAAAWWLDEMLGAKPTESKFEDFTTVPYIGPDDFRYILLMHAAIKTGRKVMLPFPANTPEGLVRLLELSKSQVALAPASHKQIWSVPLAQNPDVQFLEVPDIGKFIHDEPVKPYPYERTTNVGINDPIVLIQTSGTTGHPKPILWSSRFLKEYIEDAALLSYHALASEKMALHSILDGSYCPNLLPISWAAGLGMTVFFALYTNTVPIMLPVASMAQPLTAEYVNVVGKYAPVGNRNGIVLVPDVLRNLVRKPEGRECLRRYDWVAYAGAPLDFETGDAITAMGIRVQSFIGSTDTGLYNLLLNDPKDWKIHRFPEGLHGFYMEQFNDDLYELSVKKQENDPRHVFLSDPSLEIYRTRDLWRAVPGREGYWTNAGRVDDFVKLSTLTKFNAIAIEQIVDGHPAVAKSLVAGDARTKPFIIVEPSPEIGPYDSTPEDVVNQVWPAIEAANEHLLPEARLTRALTIITQPGKPILRTAKQTVNRRNTLELYEKKIEETYKKAGYEAVPFDATGEVKRQVNGHANGHAQ